MTDAPTPQVAFVVTRAPDGSVVLGWNPQAMRMDDFLQLLWSATGVFPQRTIYVALTQPMERMTTDGAE